MIVELPGAVRVQIPPGCDAATIQAVLQAASSLASQRAIAVLMFAGTPSVFAYTQPADLRKSFTGLVGIVERELGQTVESGHLFLFFNRRRNSVKVLAFVGDGLLICVQAIGNRNLRIATRAQ